MPRPSREPDWKAWLRSWDRQQETLIPDRERRFEAMFDVLDAALGGRFSVVDMGCGPGPLSLRLLRRFPRAHSFGIDLDPVLLRLGREAIGTVGGRLTWIEADLRQANWMKKLPVKRIDAAVSTTALHWLAPSRLRSLYRDLRTVLRPGGVFLNGDYLPSESTGTAFHRLTKDIARIRIERNPRLRNALSWNQWWRALEKEPVLRPLFRIRRTRFPQLHPREEHLSLEGHERALLGAGFREVGMVRQELEDRVLCAIR